MAKVWLRARDNNDDGGGGDGDDDDDDRKKAVGSNDGDENEPRINRSWLCHMRHGP